MFILIQLVGSLAFAAAAISSDTTAVCMYLYKQFPQDLAFDPLGPNALLTVNNAAIYTDINTNYWNSQNSQYRSACTFFPSTAQQVSVAVKQLNKYPSVPFGLKSGGHNPAPGFSSTDGGVLISFEPNLASTIRTSDGSHFVVGMGARWEDVYEVAGQTKQVAVGGRLGDIGVGGFVLGGGLSYYSAQYGLACDNVDNFEAVLANGTIVNASRTSHPDLWWALRGGGNQFAIVTRITTQAHPEGKNGQVWGGIRSYSLDKVPALFSAVTNFTRNYPDKKAAVIPTFLFGAPANLLNAIEGSTVFFFYDGPTPSNAFAEFDAIEAFQDNTTTQSYYDLTQVAGAGKLPQGAFGNSFRADTIPNLPLTQMVEYLNYYHQKTFQKSFLNSLENLDLQILSVDTQPMSVVVQEAMQAQGGNALGFDPANGDRIWIENSITWLGNLCDTQCPTFSKTSSDQLLAYQMKHYGGIAPTNYKSGNLSFTNYNPIFMNDAAPYQQIYPSYGEANLARLQSIKKAYDPTGFFTTRQGGFKLPSS